ncbi:hypothetical protein [Ekhidna sp.]
MKHLRIALIHCPKSTTYKLVKMTQDMDENDPCVMWVFDSSNMRVAKKIMKNLNVANVINTTGYAFA